MQKLLVAATLCGVFTAQADLRIRMKVSTGNSAPQETAMFHKGERERMESGKRMVVIQQPDKQQMILVDDEAKTYTIMPRTNGASTGAAGGATAQPGKPEEKKKGGVVKVYTEMTDTGERKQMFGFEARHIRTVMRHEAGADACQPGKTRMETDGWYIDWQPEHQKGENGGMQQRAAAAGGCQDEVQMENKGSAKLGYPVAYTMKTWQGDAKEPVVMTYEVTDLSQETLDAALFEIPAGYNQAGNARALVTQAVAATAQKAPGVLRVGVIAPGYLNDPLQQSIRAENIDTVTLASADQAKRAECDYVLTANPAAGAEAAPVKKRGMFGALAKATAGVDAGVKTSLAYKLDRVADGAQVLNGVENGKQGGGFGWKNALQVASMAQGSGLTARAAGGNYLAYHAMDSVLRQTAYAGGVSMYSPMMYGGAGSYYGAVSAMQYAATSMAAAGETAPADAQSYQPTVEKVAKAVAAAVR